MIALEVKKYCLEKIKEYYELADEIRGIWGVFIMEVADEEVSMDNEAELLYSAIEELIEEYENKK